MKFQCVVFDIDGTLMNSEEVLLKGLQQTLKQLTGKDYDLADLQFAWGIPGVDTARRLNYPDEHQLCRAWEDAVTPFRREVHSYAGIEELLMQLKNAGLRIGIVTSQDRREYDRAFPLKHFFEPELVVTADQTVLHKPHPDPLLEILKRTGLTPDQVLYTGDTPYDSQCAKDAGIAFGLAVWGAAHPDQIRADHYFRTPAELARLCL